MSKHCNKQTKLNRKFPRKTAKLLSSQYTQPLKPTIYEDKATSCKYQKLRSKSFETNIHTLQNKDFQLERHFNNLRKLINLSPMPQKEVSERLMIKSQTLNQRQTLTVQRKSQSQKNRNNISPTPKQQKNYNRSSKNNYNSLIEDKSLIQLMVQRNNQSFESIYYQPSHCPSKQFQSRQNLIIPITEQSSLFIGYESKKVDQLTQLTSHNIKQLMAIKIQTAWKSFNTRNIIKKIVGEPYRRKIFFKLKKTNQSNKNQTTTIHQKYQDKPMKLLKQVIIIGESILNCRNLNESEEIKSSKSQQSSLQFSENEQQTIMSSFSWKKQINLCSLTQIFKLIKIKRKKQQAKVKLLSDEIQKFYYQGILSKKQYQQKKQVILKETKQKINQINSTKNSLGNAYKNAKYIINKQKKSLQVQKLHNMTDLKLKKCISQDFLNKKSSLNYLKFLEKRQVILNQPFVKVKARQITQSNQCSDEEQTKNQIQKNILKLMKQPLKDNYKQQNTQEDFIPSEEIKIFNIKKKKDLSTLTQRQKNNIFQLLFLDLIFQILTDLPEESQAFSRIEDSIRKISKLYKNRTLGLQKADIHVKKYLNNIKLFIRSQNQSFLDDLEIINGPRVLQMLLYMRQYDINAEESLVQPVLKRKVYELVQKHTQKSLVVQECFLEEQKQEKWERYIKNLHLIYNKAIFDCLNQYLDYERPFGIFGSPYPWKCSIAKRKFNYQERDLKLSRSCLKVQKLIQYKCGLMNGGNIIDQYVNINKEQRLLIMLKDYVNIGLFLDE